MQQHATANDPSAAPADLVFLLEADGTIVDFYQAEGIALYLPPDGFLGKRPQDVLPDAVGNAFRQALARARADADSASFQYELPMPDGHRRFAARLAALASSERYVAVVRDITEQAVAEQRLRERDSLLETMFAQTTDAIVLADPETARIIECNEAACRALGYTRDEFVGLAIPDFEADHDPETIKANIQAILNGDVRGFESRMRTKDGALRDVRLTFRLVEHDGRRMISGVWQDITERKRQERQQSARNELLRIQNQLIRELSQSTAFIDGDLPGFSRQITEAIGTTLAVDRVSVWLLDDGHSELACVDLFELADRRHRAAGTLSPELYRAELAILARDRRVAADDARGDPRTARYADAYLRPLDIRSLLGIINDILDFSKIEADKIQLQDDEFELARVIENCCALVTPSMIQKGLELRGDLDHLPLRVRGDSTRFGQIMLNLISNAAKVTESGEVSVTGNWSETGVEQTPGDASGEAPLLLRFAVRDTGIGMSAVRRLQMASPKPLPPYLRVVELSA